MKKTIVWLLLSCILASIFFGCQPAKDPEAETSGSDTFSSDTVLIPKDKLVIVRPETVSQAVSMELRSLKSAFQVLQGKNVEIISELEKSEEANKNTGMTEILIGQTNRSVSKAVYGELPEAGYSVSYREDAIAIGGTNEAMLIYAIRLFCEQCVFSCTGEASLAVSRELLFKNEADDIITLIDKGEPIYSLAYSAECDYMPNTGSVNNGLDIEVDLLLQLQKSMQALTDQKIVNTSTEKEDSARFEILIGVDGKTEFEAARKNWQAGQYGVVELGNKLVISAWSDAGLEKAVAEFTKLIDQATEEQNGKKTVRFMKDHLSACSDSEWILDIPAYEGGTLSGANDCAYGQYLQYITETNGEEYRAYCSALERAGYMLHLSNQIGDNLFSTYVKNKTKIHTYYTHAEGAVRIITGNTDTTGLIAAEDTSATKLAESSLTQMGLSYGKSGGMGYVITLEDGRFVIIDGGNNLPEDALKLYKLLQRMNKRQDGIVIAAWILTHEHGDHYGVLQAFLPEYGTRVKIQNMYVSIPSESYRHNSLNPSDFMTNEFVDLTNKHGKIPVTVLHTGQKFKISNVTFEVLYTTEDLYPKKLDFFNDASMVLRADFGTGDTGKVLFLGDIADAASEVLCNMYGKALKTHTVQVAHHGWNGATLALYSNVGAKVLLWPNSQTEYDKSTASTGKEEYHQINRLLVSAMGVEKIRIADGTHHRMSFSASGVTFAEVSYN